MNIIRNTLSWYISDTVSTRNSKRLMQGIVPSHYAYADKIGLSFRGPSHLVFIQGGHYPEVWWREGGHWSWEALTDICHIWGVEYEHS